MIDSYPHQRLVLELKGMKIVSLAMQIGGYLLLLGGSAGVLFFAPKEEHNAQKFPSMNIYHLWLTSWCLIIVGIAMQLSDMRLLNPNWPQLALPLWFQ